MRPSSCNRGVLFALVLLATASPFALAAAEDGRSWPYNLPAHEKYWPEHEALAKRHAQVMERMATQTPVGMRKMSDDPGEMFFLDYWQFEDDVKEDEEPATLLRPRSAPETTYNNTTMLGELLPPFLLHTEEQVPQHLRFLPRNLFDKRNFQCPTGTSACSSISRPNSCCATDETCVIVKDTGLGDVGCCPSGQDCGGSVSACNTAQGFTSCPESSNGGCCIPDFACQGVGCVKTGFAATTTEVVLTVSQAANPQPRTSEVTTTATVYSTNTVLQAPAVVTRTVYTTIAVNATSVLVQSAEPSCTRGYRLCAASLGGGCCPTDRACGSDTSCPPLPSSTAGTTATDAAPPVRPTGDDPQTMTTTTQAPQYCPTGYYMCSARYIGGCCQVDRDCQSTSCPLTSSTTILDSGETVIVPLGTADSPAGNGDAAPPSTSGAAPAPSSAATVTTTLLPVGAQYCATGWYACGADAGGGCCPSGYGCGASCTKTADGQGPGRLDKVAPAVAGAERLLLGSLGWLLASTAVVSGLGMILL